MPYINNHLVTNSIFHTFRTMLIKLDRRERRYYLCGIKDDYCVHIYLIFDWWTYFINETCTTVQGALWVPKGPKVYTLEPQAMSGLMGYRDVRDYIRCKVDHLILYSVTLGEESVGDHRNMLWISRRVGEMYLQESPTDEGSTFPSDDIWGETTVDTQSTLQETTADIIQCTI